MIVTLTFTAQNDEIISGIPRFVEITSSEPASIYYTLDGTLPSQLSTAYTGPIEMPKGENSVTLSAVGYVVDQFENVTPTPVLSNVYYSDVSEITKTRYFFFEGIVYMYPGGLDLPFWYDSSGNESVFIDVLEEELDNITLIPDRDELGAHRETDNEVSRIDPERTATLIDNDFKLFDTPDSDTFNPEALFIRIDGRNETNTDDVLLINGPHLSLRDPRRNYAGLDFYSNKNTNYRSSNFARSYYNRDKGIVVFYYYDTNNGRWVQSIQNLPDMDTSNLVKPSMGNPVVFKWFNFGRHQNI